MEPLPMIYEVADPNFITEQEAINFREIDIFNPPVHQINANIATEGNRSTTVNRKIKSVRYAHFQTIKPLLLGLAKDYNTKPVTITFDRLLYHQQDNSCDICWVSFEDAEEVCWVFWLAKNNPNSNLPARSTIDNHLIKICPYEINGGYLYSYYTKDEQDSIPNFNSTLLTQQMNQILLRQTIAGRCTLNYACRHDKNFKPKLKKLVIMAVNGWRQYFEAHTRTNFWMQAQEEQDDERGLFRKFFTSVKRGLFGKALKDLRERAVLSLLDLCKDMLPTFGSIPRPDLVEAIVKKYFGLFCGAIWVDMPDKKAYDNYEEPEKVEKESYDQRVQRIKCCFLAATREYLQSKSIEEARRAGHEESDAFMRRNNLTHNMYGEEYIFEAHKKYQKNKNETNRR